MYWDHHLIPPFPFYDLLRLLQLIKGRYCILIREFIEFHCRLLGYFWLSLWVDPQSQYPNPFFLFGLSESLRHPLSRSWCHFLSLKPPLETMYASSPVSRLTLSFPSLFYRVRVPPFAVFSFLSFLLVSVQQYKFFYSLQFFYCTIGNSVEGHIEVFGKILLFGS